MYIHLTTFDPNDDQFLPKIQELKEKESLHILVHSGGGTFDMALLYVHEIKRLSLLGHKIKVSALWLGSSAFTFFWLLRDIEGVERIVLSSCYGVIHDVAVEVFVMPSGQTRGRFDTFRATAIVKNSMTYPFLTEEQKLVYEKGDEIYLTARECAYLCNAVYMDQNSV